MPPATAGPPPHGAPRWVLLAYRLPREPSTPRIAVWRKLDQLGVVRLGDGLVGVPADARTREHLDRIAEEVRQASGTASVWLATATDAAQEETLIEAGRAARSAEYRSVLAEARSAAAAPDLERRRALRRLRARLRRIERRDFFAAPQRDEARAAVATLNEDAGGVPGAADAATVAETAALGEAP
jgi:hypothetical protein